MTGNIKCIQPDVGRLIRHFCSTIALLGLITGCGGGVSDDANSIFCVLNPFECASRSSGGSESSTGSDPYVPWLHFRPAMTISAKGGWSASLTATGDGSDRARGDCSGTYDFNQGPADTSTTFEGVQAVSATRITQMELTNCTPASEAETSIVSYACPVAGSACVSIPIGWDVLGGSHAKWASEIVIPNYVHVGDQAFAGTYNIYADSTKTVFLGRINFSWVIEPDTQSTGIANLIYEKFDASANLLVKEENRYRISTGGGMPLVSVEIQTWETTPPLHLVFK